MSQALRIKSRIPLPLNLGFPSPLLCQEGPGLGGSAAWPPLLQLVGVFNLSSPSWLMGPQLMPSYSLMTLPQVMARSMLPFKMLWLDMKKAHFLVNYLWFANGVKQPYRTVG